MRITLPAVLLLICALAAQAQTTPSVPAPALAPADLSKVVATVNGKELPLSQLAALTLGMHGKIMLETLIYHEVVRQEARRQGVTITQQEVDEFVKKRVADEMEKQARQMGAKDLQDLMTKTTVTAAEVEQLRRTTEEAMRPFVGPEMLARKLLRKEVSVSDAQVRAEFDRRYGPRVKLSQIVLRTRAEADETLKKAQAGADFAELARQLSIDRVSARDGGALQPMPGGSALADAAFSLKPGEIGPVVEIDNNFHVIKLIEKLDPDATGSFDKVKEQIRDELLEKEMKARSDTWLLKLAQKADIKRSY